MVCYWKGQRHVFWELTGFYSLICTRATCIPTLESFTTFFSISVVIKDHVCRSFQMLKISERHSCSILHQSWKLYAWVHVDNNASSVLMKNILSNTTHKEKELFLVLWSYCHMRIQAGSRWLLLRRSMERYMIWVEVWHL